jgi:Ca2+-binding RTX toxin-like protein
MATITGTNSSETKTGTAAADTITGLGGNDTLYGRAGNDTISGDAGTDKLYSEAGNDILKGGTGIGYLYGGDGKDQLFYDPTTDNIAKVGQSLAGSVLKGDAGTDTLNISNKATYTSGTATKPALTEVYVDDAGIGHITLTKPDAAWDFTGSDAGTYSGIESVVAAGGGGLRFTADLVGSGVKNVTGSAAADQFFGGFGGETFKGGAGNDDFRGGGGTDTFVSEETDADRFFFDLKAAGKTAVTGFNGAGVKDGDTIIIDPYLLTSPKTQISEYAGTTTFKLTADMSFTVDAVGLKQDVDWFFT